MLQRDTMFAPSYGVVGSRVTALGQMKPDTPRKRRAISRGVGRTHMGERTRWTSWGESAFGDVGLGDAWRHPTLAPEPGEVLLRRGSRGCSAGRLGVPAGDPPLQMPTGGKLRGKPPTSQSGTSARNLVL